MWVLGQLVVVLILLYVIGTIVYRGRGEEKYAFLWVLIHFVLLLVSSGVILLVLTLAMLLFWAAVDLVLQPESYDLAAHTSVAELLGRFPTGTFLMGLLIFILSAAIIHYLLRRRVLRRFPLLSLDGDDYEICEYFIQWMTIYLAVYQFFFDGLNRFVELLSTAQDAAQVFDVFLTPTNINLVLQPLLITTWIVVVMEKLRARHLEADSAETAQ